MPQCLTPAAPSRWRLAGGDGAAILCVEDNDDTRAVLCEILEWEGYEVTPAASVREALQALACADPFGLILTDYSLPDGTGTAMLQLAKRQGHVDESTPVVLFTGERHPQCDAGMMLIRKPLQPDVLLDAIRDLLVARQKPRVNRGS